jgi:type I restriction enzyme S subunit
VIGPRLKDLGRWFSGGTPPSERAEYWDGDVPWLSGKDFNKTVLREPTKFTTATGAALHSRLVPGGQTVLVLVRGMALAHGLPVARLPFDAAINQDVRGLVLRPEFDPEFVYYALVGRRAELNAHIDRAAHGTARLLETVYSHRIAWMPELTAQRTIATFLDRECERISAAASRESELTSCLSRVPAGLFEADHRVRAAERVPLRFSLRAVEQGWSPQCEARLAEPGGWGVTKTGAANYGHFRPDEHKALPVDLRPLPEFELRVGDLVMSRANTRELAGSAARVRELGGWRLLMCDKLYRLGVRDQVLDPDFAVLAINSREARRQIEASTSGASASMQNISQDVVRGLRLPRPSLADQRAIVARVNAASRDVARSMSIASELRVALTAYRSSLIHEAVTGKLDVTSLSDRQMDERLHAAAENRLDEVAV